MARDFNLRSVITGAKGADRSILFGEFRSESVALEVADLIRDRIKARYKANVRPDGTPFPDTKNNWIDTGTLLDNIRSVASPSAPMIYRAEVLSDAKRKERPDHDYAGYVAYRTGYMGLASQDRLDIKKLVYKRFGIK